MSTYTEAVGDVDIIFAGGGAAACAAAGRLAKANPSLKILLVEGGANNFQNPMITTPALFPSHLVPESKTALIYKSKKNEQLNGREAVVLAGGVLGGGSSINFLMYTRAQAVDYDNWHTEGWSGKDMLRVCKKLETFHPSGDDYDENKHGRSGPIHVSDGGYRGKSENIFLATTEKMGYPRIKDSQDFESIGGFGKWQRYVSPDGKRQDAAHSYVHPLLQGGQHPNLHILLDSKVIRVLFDSSSPPRAIGVEYKPNAEHQPVIALSQPDSKIIMASKFVVLSAGALATPQILERSGIGMAEILKKLDIPVISELSNVGENYQDHHLMIQSYKTSLDEHDTLDGILSRRQDMTAAVSRKMLGWNGQDVAGKLRPTAEEVQSMGPACQEAWNSFFANHPTRPAMLMPLASLFLGDPSLVDPGQYISIANISTYPFSRGSIHINSRTDVLDGYDFHTGFLSDPTAFDLKIQLWAYKRNRDIARHLPYFAGELAFTHPTFREGSGAALSAGPLPAGAIADLVYDEEDDRAIEHWIRENLGTTWHSSGTCAMGKRAEGGVVDRFLNVYGTRGLKLCDLSICPGIVGSNTCNTAMAIGEMAAEIIGREMGFEV